MLSDFHLIKDQLNLLRHYELDDKNKEIINEFNAFIPCTEELFNQYYKEKNLFFLERL